MKNTFSLKKINKLFFFISTYITRIIRTCKELIYILETEDNNRYNDDELTLLSNNNDNLPTDLWIEKFES